MTDDLWPTLRQDLLDFGCPPDRIDSAVESNRKKIATEPDVRAAVEISWLRQLWEQ